MRQGIPVENGINGCRFVLWPNQSIVGLRHTDQPSKIRFRLKNASRSGLGIAIECCEHLLFKLVILLAGLSFRIGFSAFEVIVEAGFDRLPCFQRTVTSRFDRLEVSDREVQIPIGLDHFVDMFHNTFFEFIN